MEIQWDPLDFSNQMQANPMNNIRWSRGLINNGGTRSIVNGGHELMGGTLWELVKLMLFIKSLIRNRSFGEFFWNLQWSAVMDSIMAYHQEVGVCSKCRHQSGCFKCDRWKCTRYWMRPMHKKSSKPISKEYQWHQLCAEKKGAWGINCIFH